MEGSLDPAKDISLVDTEKLNHGTIATTANSEKSPAESHNTTFVEDAAMERRLTLKCDLRLLPALMILYAITFIDRTNIANAKIEGMTAELKMKNTDYNKALWILNIPYTILPVPTNMLMKKGFVKPSVFLSGQMFCWSLCTIGLGVTKSFGGVLACRFLMGCFEAGFAPDSEGKF
ncbi:hypothetical protein ACMFMG_000975 [Clarireedia jacksonii]